MSWHVMHSYLMTCRESSQDMTCAMNIRQLRQIGTNLKHVQRWASNSKYQLSYEHCKVLSGISERTSHKCVGAEQLSTLAHHPSGPCTWRREVSGKTAVDAPLVKTPTATSRRGKAWGVLGRNNHDAATGPHWIAATVGPTAQPK